MTTPIDLDALVASAVAELEAEIAERRAAEEAAERKRRKEQRDSFRQALVRALGAELAQALEAGIEEDGGGYVRLAFTWRERLVRVVPNGASEWRIYVSTRGGESSILAGTFFPDGARARRDFLLSLADGARKAEELEAGAEVQL